MNKFLAVGIFLLLVAGLAGGIYLSQQQTQLRSKASGDCTLYADPSSGQAPLNVLFQVDVPNLSEYPDSKRSRWIFGDGGSSEDLSLSRNHTYDTTFPQDYTATFQVIEAAGSTNVLASCATTVTVSPPAVNPPSSAQQPATPAAPAGGTSSGQAAFTCSSITTTPQSTAPSGTKVAINVGGKTNDGNLMSKILVYVKPPSQPFASLGEVSCSGSNCSGNVSWNTADWDPGTYTIAQRLINNQGGERNTNGDDASCNAIYTLTAAVASGGTGTCPNIADWKNIGVRAYIGSNCTQAERDRLPGEALLNFSEAELMQHFSHKRLSELPLSEKMADGQVKQVLNSFRNDNLVLIAQATGNLGQFLSKFSNERLLGLAPFAGAGFDDSILKQLPEETIRTFPCEYQQKLGFVCGSSTGPIEYKVAEGDNITNAEFNVRAATAWTAYVPVSTGGPMRIPYSLTNLKQGDIRYVSVMFRSGAVEKGPFTSKLLKYKGAGPKIAESPGPKCVYSSSGDGTEVTIIGTGFGALQGKGTLKANNKVVDIVSWTDTQILAKVKELLTGKVPLIVTSDDGSISEEKRCEVNTTSVDFKALLQCKSNNFAATNVDVRIYENIASANAKTPFYRKTISLDKEGRPQTDFSPKFEAGKNYCVVVKPPNALAKQFCFSASQNTTTSLDEPIRMLAGDVTGQGGLPDGTVGAPDFGKLRTEYGCKAGVKRLTDFNEDGCTNSFDYSCIRESIRLNEKDDIFDPSKAPAAGSTGGQTGNRNFSVSGTAFLDSDGDSVKDTGENILSGVTVKALRPTAETPGQSLTAAQAASATVLGQATTDSSGKYSMILTPPTSIMNLVIWIDPSSTTGQGGQKAIGIGAIPDSTLTINPLIMDIPVKPSSSRDDD